MSVCKSLLDLAGSKLVSRRTANRTQGMFTGIQFWTLSIEACVRFELSWVHACTTGGTLIYRSNDE